MLETASGLLRCGQHRQKTRIKNGAAAGIAMQDGHGYFAPLVISSAGVRRTALKLVGEEHFDRLYAAGSGSAPIWRSIRALILMSHKGGGIRARNFFALQGKKRKEYPSWYFEHF